MPGRDVDEQVAYLATAARLQVFADGVDVPAMQVRICGLQDMPGAADEGAKTSRALLGLNLAQRLDRVRQQPAFQRWT